MVEQDHTADFEASKPSSRADAEVLDRWARSLVLRTITVEFGKLQEIKYNWKQKK